MANGKFQIFTDKAGEFRFRLRAANNEIVLGSEGYTSKSSCKNGIDSVKENAPKNERYKRKTSKNGEPYFNLVAGNGEIIGVSEMYSSEQARDNGIEAVKDAAPQASVEDQT